MSPFGLFRSRSTKHVPSIILNNFKSLVWYGRIYRKLNLFSTDGEYPTIQLPVGHPKNFLLFDLRLDF